MDKSIDFIEYKNTAAPASTSTPANCSAQRIVSNYIANKLRKSKLIRFILCQIDIIFTFFINLPLKWKRFKNNSRL